MMSISNSLVVITMSKALFEGRMTEDIKLRSYYGKFIFNSHFLVFLMIAAGVMLYTLLGLRETLSPGIHIDLICAIVLSIFINPKYRSLLKEADMLFLPPYEKHMTAYFKRADIYSLSLGIVPPIAVSIAVMILLTIGHDLTHIILFFFVALILYFNTFSIKRLAVNTELKKWMVNLILFVLNFVSLFLIQQHSLFIILALAIVVLSQVSVRKIRFKTLSWLNYTAYEQEESHAYFQVVSMFTNVKQIDKSFKRRAYLDLLLPDMKGEKFNKKNMYEYLFYRSFLRDHDLPMIVLRIIILFFIIMFWISNFYISLVFSLFGIYIIVLQMSQIYTNQAYLLWPKIWPVNRSYIQDSYIRYSHKMVLLISIIFTLMFIIVESEYFYIGLLFPLWGHVLNRFLSRSIYKKEEELSD